MLSEALTPAQMLSILASMGHYVRLDSFEPKEDSDDVRKCLVEIDTYVESALPPILMYGQHVVLVVGHSLKNGNKEYVIFDDSGYHLDKLMGVKYFAYKVPAEVLERELRKQALVFVATFEFERQYFPLKSVELVVDALVAKKFTKRILLVDSRDLKSQFRDTINALENMNLPHFLWLVEIYDQNEIAGGLIVDASTHKLDYQGSLIASWNRENVKFYKHSNSFIKIGATIVPFVNLQEIK